LRLPFPPHFSLSFFRFVESNGFFSLGNLQFFAAPMTKKKLMGHHPPDDYDRRNVSLHCDEQARERGRPPATHSRLNAAFARQKKGK